MVSPQYHDVYDDQFATVPHMQNLSVPHNWAQLVRISSELVTTEQFDLTKTWFEGQDNVTTNTILQPPEEDPMTNLQDTIARSQSQAMLNEGVAVNSTPIEGAATSDNTSNEGGPTLPVFRSLR